MTNKAEKCHVVSRDVTSNTKFCSRLHFLYLKAHFAERPSPARPDMLQNRTLWLDRTIFQIPGPLKLRHTGQNSRLHKCTGESVAIRHTHTLHVLVTHEVLLVQSSRCSDRHVIVGDLHTLAS